MSITLFENFRALFYAPFYAAFGISAYERENVDVTLAPMSAPGDGSSAILDGADAITWGGPMRVMRNHDENPESDLVSFCEVVGKDPFQLVGRTPKADFKIPDLVGIRFASFLEAPTPWLCLQEDLRRENIDPNSIDRTGDRAVTDIMEGFQKGEFDLVQVPEPYAQALVDGGHGHIWYETAHRGACCYTTFSAKRSFIDAHQEEVGAMYAAQAATLQWIQDETAGEIAKVVVQFFPDVPPERLKQSIDRYKCAGLWSRNPAISKTGLERLRAGLLSGGFIERAIPYEEMVETRFDTPG